MFKLHKTRGVSLIELMVAVGLGLILILSMLAFYSVSQKNTIDHQVANQEQQKLRTMLNVLTRDLENTGGFECANYTDIFGPDIDGFTKGHYRLPRDIISLGENLKNRQIIFVHPVLEEYRFHALGLFDISTNDDIADYAPRRVESGCGQDTHSPLLIGATLLEIVPITDMNPTANDITAFMSLSSIHAKQSEDDTDIMAGPYFNPPAKDGTVLFFSNNDPTQEISLPFGNNTVDIFLGFSPPGRFTHIPETNPSLKFSLETGGWINPFENQENYDLLVDKSNTKTPKPTLLNTKLDSNSGAIYPLKPNAIKQIRAVKFQFTFNADNPNNKQVITRVIRFKNTHLMKLGDNNDDTVSP